MYVYVYIYIYIDIYFKSTREAEGEARGHRRLLAAAETARGGARRTLQLIHIQIIKHKHLS